MPDAPEIKVKLKAEDTGVAAAIKELGAQLKNLKAQQDSTAGSSIKLGDAFKGLLAVIAVEKLISFGKATLDSATAIARASQVTGASTQTLGVFQKTAEDLGISSEAVTKGFVKLSRSILEFQQGSAKAAKNFQQLGVSQKDLAGLNTDQKIKLVTDRLGSMADGTTKAALAQTLLGRSGAELIPVLNDLAGEGFEKARASAEKFGLLLDGDAATSLLLAKKGLADLGDVGKGIATQFGAGLAPAITDIANALVKATTKDGVGGFKSLGEAAGSAMKGVLIGIVAVVAGIVEIGAKTSALVQNIGRATADALTKGPKAAWQAFERNELGDAARIDAEIQSREAALLSELQGNTRQQDAADEKAKAARRAKNVPEVIAATPASDAAARAQLALDDKQLQDELAIHRAYAAQTAEVDKEMYDQGQISLAEYYDRRKTAIIADTEEEVTILRQGVVRAQAEATKAKAEAAKAPAGSKDQDKQHAAEIQALTKVEELQTKISLLQISSSTKITALDDETNKKREESQQHTLEFERELAELQGKRQQVAKAQIDAEVAKRTRQVQQSGGDPALLAEIEQWKQLKLAAADYEAAKEKSKQDVQAFDIQKQGIEIKAKAGQISPLEAEREINELIKDRLPLLQADAAAELNAAKKTGNQDDVANAQATQQQFQNLGVSANKLGTQIGESLNSDFTTFFETVGRGSQSVAQSFQHLAASVIQSIEQILIKMLLLKIATSVAGGAGGGGGFLSSVFAGLGGGQGHAEGGLIKGPGGPKADAIPARLSAGEYVVKADAVKNFGAHNLEAINRGLKPPSFENLQLPRFAEGGLVGAQGAAGASGSVHLGIGLDKGLILQHLTSKDAGRIILDHITNNPKAAGKALGRSQG
jgi:hypothetical protein